ncbi:MAG: hypothetical protein SR1Q5_03275 [Quinella sp. 1Q5]|nr:hypothetical protein [Quinella sp. 1Q5]
MSKFSKAAARLSNQTSDLELMRLDEVIAKYPDGLTIDYMELVTSEEGNQYVRFTFLEEPKKYSTGSGDFMQLWNYLMEDYGSNVEQLQEDLKACPERVKIWKVKTKTKKTYTKVKSLGEGSTAEDEALPLG